MEYYLLIRSTVKYIIIKDFLLFLTYKKEGIASLSRRAIAQRPSRKEIKAKRRIVSKEFKDELLDLLRMQNKMEKIYFTNEQQVKEIDEMYDKIDEYKEIIKYLTITPAI